MRKILVLALFIVLAASLVHAAGQGIHEPGTGIENPELKETAQGTGQGLDNQTAGAGQMVQTGTEAQQQNRGEDAQIRAQAHIQNRLMSGEYLSETGKQLQVREQANNRIRLNVGDASADTSLEMVQEQVLGKTMLKAKLSNGKNADVKVMPDTASERALERLRLRVCSENNACQIELKETGQGDQMRAVYELRAQRQSKVLGLFRANMQVRAQVDSENGEVLRTHKPWWAFLATEPAE